VEVVEHLLVLRHLVVAEQSLGRLFFLGHLALVSLQVPGLRSLEGILMFGELLQKPVFFQLEAVRFAEIQTVC